jgi:hypothetical protein
MVFRTFGAVCLLPVGVVDLHAWRLRQHDDTSAKEGFASR